jgi:hypothetical protein
MGTRREARKILRIRKTSAINTNPQISEPASHIHPAISATPIEGSPVTET